MNMPTSKLSFSLVQVCGDNWPDSKFLFLCSSRILRMYGCTYSVVCEFVHSFFLLDHPGIDNTPQIERFQEKAYMELQDYVTRTYPEDSYRCVGFTFALHNASTAGKEVVYSHKLVQQDRLMLLSQIYSLHVWISCLLSPSLLAGYPSCCCVFQPSGW